MKKITYILIILFSVLAISCTEEVVAPREGEDDPIVIPPPPPPPPKK